MRCASRTCRCSIIRPLTVTTPRPSACASSYASMISPACSMSASLGANASFVGLDLARVDEGLAVEAHLAALTRLGGEAFRVLHVVVDAVEDDLAGRAGGEQGDGQ